MSNTTSRKTVSRRGNQSVTSSSTTVSLGPVPSTEKSVSYSPSVSSSSGSSGKEPILVLDPTLETLHFEEPPQVFFNVSDQQRVALKGDVLLVRHYLTAKPTESKYQDEHQYLHGLFRHYLVVMNQKKDGGAASKGGGGGGVGEKPPPRSRNSMIVQFHPHVTEQFKRTPNTPNYPTYGVSYEFVDDPKGDPSKGPVILIAYREITKRSFLSSMLQTYVRVLDPTKQTCLMIESSTTATGPYDKLIPTGTMVTDQFSATPKLMSIHDDPSGSITILSVAPHGWLVFFLKYHPEAAVLLSHESLVLSGSIPLTYKRIQDMGSLAGEYFLRSTQLGAGAHLVVKKAVVHNEAQDGAFSVLGFGNAQLGLTFLRQMSLKVKEDDAQASDKADPTGSNIPQTPGPRT